MDKHDLDVLMELVFQNDLILHNMFSWLDLKTIKDVRRVNHHWNRAAASVFSNLSLINLHLTQELRGGVLITSLYSKCKPIIELIRDEDILEAIGNRLASFKHFQLLAITSRMQSIDVAYTCLDKLLRHLWSPTASIKYYLDLSVSNCLRASIKAMLYSVLDALNAFPNIETKLEKSYADGMQINCTTLNIYAYLNDVDKVRNLSHFYNIKKIAFKRGTSIVADCLHYIVQNHAQFDKLVDIEVEDYSYFTDIGVLTQLHFGLERLTLDITLFLGNFSLSHFEILETCLIRHAPTLTFLRLTLKWNELLEGFKLTPIEFPKLKSLILYKRDYQSHEHYDNGGQSDDSSDYSSDDSDGEEDAHPVLNSDIDFFDIRGMLGRRNFRKYFPQLTTLQIIESSQNEVGVLADAAIVELQMDEKLKLILTNSDHVQY